VEIVAQGDRIYLRNLLLEDITERYLNWFGDPEITHYLESSNLTFDEVKNYMNEGKLKNTYYMFAICLNNTNLHIGNLKLGPIVWKHGLSDLVTVIGDKAYWRKGYASEAIKLGTQLAFEKYNVRKLSGGMYADNIASIKAYTKAGWHEEARLGSQYIIDGNIIDRICICCFNPKYCF
jgi:ribosomal-protein-alanine N-acetyltransferase